MHVIASTGGKGGTGKSTFAILLSFKLSREGKKVLLCDCDVECPNDHLLFGRKLSDPEPIYRKFPKLNEEKCVSCGTCSKVCKSHAVMWIKGKPPVFFEDLCSGCRACWIACPEKAIETKMKIVGDTFVAKINDKLWLLSGISKPGVTETGPIVKVTKTRALRLAEEIRADTMIVDTSPGTHCNVIQALLGCEIAYIVTEPTPLGSHDSGLILELLRIMQIKSQIVLNKSDIGNKEIITKTAQKYDVPITLEIPYSERLIRAYSEGRLNKLVDLI